MATFSLTDTVRRVVATGDGSATDYSFSFQVNDTTDVKVYVDDVLQTSPTDYSIVNSTLVAGLNTDGTGVVKFVTAPANSTTVSILSQLPLSRSNVYTSGGNITGAALEDDFDTLAMKMGDGGEQLQRALKAPPSELTTADLTIPDKDTRAGKNLAFDSSGNPTVSSASVTGASVGTTTTGAAGTSAVATATYDSNTGNVEFDFTIPQGAQGAAGNNGIFTAIATQAEAQAGTENTKGMTSLRVSEAISAQVSGISAVASKFFGVKKRVEHVTLHGQDFYRTILVQEHTLVGGSEKLVLSDYETYFFATGSVGLSLRTSDGHLLIDLP